MLFFSDSESWEKGGNRKDVNSIFSAGRKPRELFPRKDMGMDTMELHAMSCKGGHVQSLYRGFLLKLEVR